MTTPKQPTSFVISEKATGLNQSALEETLSALRDLGRIEVIDGALIALCESTARAIDESPGRAALVKEYRECLVLLGGLGSDGSDAFDRLMSELSGTQVGDTPST